MREMSPSPSSDWRSFPNYLSGPLSPASPPHPHHSPLLHSSSLPSSSPPIAMSFPVQSTYHYSFHDSHIPLQPQVPVNAPYSYPSPELDLQHILDMPIPTNILHHEPESTHPPLLPHSEQRDNDPILSPVSVNSFMTPCQSPVEMLSPLDYPTPTSLHAPVKGTLVHTILPQSSFPENHVINFNVSVSLTSPLLPPHSPLPLCVFLFLSR